jgi:hypothetical protein
MLAAENKQTEGEPMHLTEQMAFNLAYIGVVNQGVPSISGGSCKYLSPNGNRCAAGFIFSEMPGFDSSKHEGEDASTVLSSLIGYDADDPEELAGMAEFLDMIQAAHDVSAHNADGFDEFVSLYKSDMAEIAELYRLTIPSV